MGLLNALKRSTFASVASAHLGVLTPREAAGYMLQVLAVSYPNVHVHVKKHGNPPESPTEKIVGDVTKEVLSANKERIILALHNAIKDNTFHGDLFAIQLHRIGLMNTAKEKFVEAGFSSYGHAFAATALFAWAKLVADAIRSASKQKKKMNALSIRDALRNFRIR